MKKGLFVIAFGLLLTSCSSIPKVVSSTKEDSKDVVVVDSLNKEDNNYSTCKTSPIIASNTILPFNQDITLYSESLSLTSLNELHGSIFSEESIKSCKIKEGAIGVGPGYLNTITTISDQQSIKALVAFLNQPIVEETNRIDICGGYGYSYTIELNNGTKEYFEYNNGYFSILSNYHSYKLATNQCYNYPSLQERNISHSFLTYEMQFDITDYNDKIVYKDYVQLHKLEFVEAENVIALAPSYKININDSEIRIIDSNLFSYEGKYYQIISKYYNFSFLFQ